MKSHLLKQNNNNESSPQASPRCTPNPSLDSTATVVEAVKNGQVEETKPPETQPPAQHQPSPGLAQVSSMTQTLRKRQLNIGDSQFLSYVQEEKESSNDSSTAFIPPTEPKDNNNQVVSEVSHLHLCFCNLKKKTLTEGQKLKILNLTVVKIDPNDLKDSQ